MTNISNMQLHPWQLVHRLWLMTMYGTNPLVTTGPYYCVSTDIYLYYSHANCCRQGALHTTSNNTEGITRGRTVHSLVDSDRYSIGYMIRICILWRDNNDRALAWRWGILNSTTIFLTHIISVQKLVFINSEPMIACLCLLSLLHYDQIW